MKTGIYILLMVAAFHFAKAQTEPSGTKPPSVAVRFDGIYECKEWKFIDDKADNPTPAFARFFADGTMLFCHYIDPKDIDSSATPETIYKTILTEEILNKIKENMEDDPANVYKKYKKFKITAYKYQKLPNGICFDILSERPNCLGKPNLKVISPTVVRTLSQSGDPVDDRLYKFVQVN